MLRRQLVYIFFLLCGIFAATSYTNGLKEKVAYWPKQIYKNSVYVLNSRQNSPTIQNKTNEDIGKPVFETR